MKEQIIGELAQSGIFILDSKDQTMETALFKLCQMGLLFPSSSTKFFLFFCVFQSFLKLQCREELPLDNLLPIGEVSPFHKFFIEYCISNELPNVLAQYLDVYNLGKTAQSVQQLGIRIDEPWVKLFFQFRFHNLFDASLANAQLCLKVSLSKLLIFFLLKKNPSAYKTQCKYDAEGKTAIYGSRYCDVQPFFFNSRCFQVGMKYWLFRCNKHRLE